VEDLTEEEQKQAEEAWGLNEPLDIPEQEQNPADEELDPDSECMICLVDLTAEATTTTTCNHVFHTSCLSDWRARNPTCPKCRQPI
jgi:hypothetical protein